MNNSTNFSILLNSVDEILKAKKEPLLSICELLNTHVDHYNWVGFYFMNDLTQTLEIGPYVGLKTEHTRIPYGKGICGQVANSAETFVVDDVHEEDNYLACSIDTKAEIVVPLFLDRKLIGQIDIDSNERNPFTKEDKEFLKALCDKISKYPKSYSSHLPE
jgi:GAF domain-containing protein